MLQHLINLHELTPDEMNWLIDTGIYIKNNPQAHSDALKGKTLLLLFEKNSTRTHLSFEVGMKQLGGSTVYTRGEHTNLNITEVSDEATVVSGYVDVILARMRHNEDLLALANASSVPVINGCDDRYHPTQALADLMTIKEQFGTTENVKVVYVGIGNNVSNSLGHATLLAGGNFTLCAPQIDPAAFDRERHAAWAKDPHYTTNNNLAQAVKDADVLYTDTWVNMEYFDDPAFEAEKNERIRMMQPYQLTEDVLNMTGKDHTLIMHCMPVHKGYEVNDTIVYHDNSVVFEQANNRLHVQKALLLWLMHAI